MVTVCCTCHAVVRCKEQLIILLINFVLGIKKERLHRCRSPYDVPQSFTRNYHISSKSFVNIFGDWFACKFFQNRLPLYIKVLIRCWCAFSTSAECSSSFVAHNEMNGKFCLGKVQQRTTVSVLVTTASHVAYFLSYKTIVNLCLASKTGELILMNWHLSAASVWSLSSTT